MELSGEDYGDEASDSSELMDLNTNGHKSTIEFIKVEHDEETQYVDESDLDEPLAKDGNTKKRNKAGKDDWNVYNEEILSKEEFVLALINAVREKPILWKRHTNGYKDLKATHEAWNTLSERFGIQSEYLREKWKILRAQFRTNRTKLRMSSDRSYQPTWFAFDAMRFLMESDGEAETAAEAIVKPAADVDNFGCAENEDEIDTQAVILELIDQVKHTPLLWDNTCDHYNNKNRQLHAWNKIAKRMNLSVDEVKMKWQRLRTQLRSILNKMRAQSSAGFSVSRPTWFGFESMLFVLKNTKLGDTGIDLTEDIKQSLPTSTAKGRETAKRPVPSGIAVKSPLSSPASIADRPLSKPITVKRIVQTLSPTAMPNIRDCKRRFIDSTVYSLPKLRRLMQNSSSPVASSPVPLDGPSDSFTSKVEPFIVKTFQNLSTITDKIAQTEASPYSGLLNHLSMVVSRKRASDFNQIEGVLLNCLNELHKFPNETKDSTRDSPATIVLDDSDRRDQVREDSNDSYG